MSERVGAIDIGGTKIVVAVADADGRVIASDRFATEPKRGAEVVLGEAIARLRGLGAGPLAAVGVGCAGPLDLDRGLVMSPPNLPGWDAYPLVETLTRELGVPVRLDNDANAAGLAEYRLGAGRGARTLVYVTVSTGIGGGVVVDGQLLHGVGGGAGELGHQTVRPDGPLCGCGNRGCLEAVASGPAIAAAARAAVAEGRASLIAELAGAEPINAGHVARAAAGGCPAAAEIWAEAIEALAIGLGNVIAILAPDRIVLGGGVSQVGDDLLVPLREALAHRVRMAPLAEIGLVQAAFSADAGLYGAVALGLEALATRRA